MPSCDSVFETVMARNLPKDSCGNLSLPTTFHEWQGASQSDSGSTEARPTYVPELCGDALEQNAEAPITRCFDEQLDRECYRVQKCDLYVIKNSASGKEIQLFAITACRQAANNDEDLFVMTLVNG